MRLPPAGVEPMSLATWMTMLVVMAIVWGGFAGVLATAVRKESTKESTEESRTDR